MKTDIFGIPIKYEAWNKQQSLPLYIADNYTFNSTFIGEFQCVVITPLHTLATISALKKQIKKIQGIDPVPVILNLSSLSGYRRKSLIQNRIPFITPKQIFLPFMGTYLTDEKEAEPAAEKFMVSTQMLFLYFLYSKKSRLYISEATKELPFTAMTMSRAVKQLEMARICTVKKDGVNKVIESNEDKLELLKNAKGYLSSPVRRSGYIKKEQFTPDLVIAGESMLSEKTMLNPGKIANYAVYERLFDKTLLMDELIDPDEQIYLELWTYDPRQFSMDGMADTISVALSFADHKDERIEEAVEELLQIELGDQ